MLQVFKLQLLLYNYNCLEAAFRLLCRNLKKNILRLTCACMALVSIAGCKIDEPAVAPNTSGSREQCEESAMSSYQKCLDAGANTQSACYLEYEKQMTVCRNKTN